MSHGRLLRDSPMCCRRYVAGRFVGGTRCGDVRRGRKVNRRRAAGDPPAGVVRMRRRPDDDHVSPTGWFVLGAPWDCSGSGRGEQAAPDALRAAGLSAQVGRDLGNVATTITSTHRDADTGVLALLDTVRAARTLTDRLAAALVNLPGQRPLVVGGDCSILLGIVPALRARGLVN